MTQQSLPWQSTTPGDAGPYSSEQWRTAWKYALALGGARGNVGPMLGSGTQPNDGLRVQAQGTPSNQVDVLPGSALVQGAFYLNDATVSLSISGNASGNPRIDTIILRASYAAQTVRLAVLQGTPAGSPVPPTLTQSVGVTWEVPLADITVASGFTSITNSNIQPRHEWANASAGVYLDSVLNNSGGVLNTGDVVIWDTTADRSVTTTTTSDDKRVIGIWQGRTANGGYGRVLTRGIGYVNTNGAVTRGNLLVSSTTAKQAAVTATSGSSGGVIGQALETTSGAGLVLTHVNAHRSKFFSYARLSDQKSNGTSPATLTAAGWRTREITTEDSDPDGIVALASNQMTLQPGNYLAWATAETTTGNAVGRLRLRDVTNNVTLGQGQQNGASTTAPGATNTLAVFATFVLTAAAAIELQHYPNLSNPAGSAISTGDNEVYAQVLFLRIGEI